MIFHLDFGNWETLFLYDFLYLWFGNWFTSARGYWREWSSTNVPTVLSVGHPIIFCHVIDDECLFSTVMLKCWTTIDQFIYLVWCLEDKIHILKVMDKMLFWYLIKKLFTIKILTWYILKKKVAIYLMNFIYHQVVPQFFNWYSITYWVVDHY